MPRFPLRVVAVRAAYQGGYAQRTPPVGLSFLGFEFGPLVGSWLLGQVWEFMDRVCWAQLLLWTLVLGPFGEVGPIW